MKQYFPNIYVEPEPIPDQSSVPDQVSAVNALVLAINSLDYAAVRNLLHSDIDGYNDQYLTDEYISTVLFPGIPSVQLSNAVIYETYATAWFNGVQVRLDLVDNGPGDFKVSRITYDQNTEFYPVIKPQEVELPPPTADVFLQSNCVQGFVAAINAGNYSSALGYLDPSAEGAGEIDEAYMTGFLFIGSPTIQLKDVQVFESEATATFDNQKVTLGLVLVGGEYRISSIFVDFKIEYYPVLFKGEIEEVPPEPVLIPLQTACAEGFVAAINAGNYVGANGAKSFLDPSKLTYSDITEDYLRNILFSGSPGNKITNLTVFNDYATMDFLSNMVVIKLTDAGSRFYISDMYLSPKIEYYPSLFSGEVELPPPPVDTIPRQTACATKLANAVNSGNFTGTNGVKSCLDPTVSTYSSIDLAYIRDTMFSGAPANKITNMKVFNTYMTMDFEDYLISATFRDTGSVCYIAKMYFALKVEYFPDKFNGTIVQPPPPVDTVAAQRACTNALFNAINSGDWTTARSQFDPNVSSYRNMWSDYIRSRMFPGAPTLKVTDYLVYETYALGTFGEDMILIKYRLVSGSYKVHEFYRLIRTEFYPNLNWSS